MAKQLEIHVGTSDNDNSMDSAIEIPDEAAYTGKPQNSYEFEQGLMSRSVIPATINGEQYDLHVYWLNGIPDESTQDDLRPSIIHEAQDWVQANNTQGGWG